MARAPFIPTAAPTLALSGAWEGGGNPVFGAATCASSAPNHFQPRFS